MDWTEGLASSAAPTGLRQGGIIAPAKEMQRADPARFPSLAHAMEVYLRTPQGNLDYQAYRQALLSGDPSLAKLSIR
jgi:hypothetical protein